MARFPHCDSRVLHAPGECKFCDESGLQQERIDQGINFTGHFDEDKATCPAWEARGANSQVFYGNVPKKQDDLDQDDIDFRVFLAIEYGDQFEVDVTTGEFLWHRKKYGSG